MTTETIVAGASSFDIVTIEEGRRWELHAFKAGKIADIIRSDVRPHSGQMVLMLEHTPSLRLKPHYIGRYHDGFERHHRSLHEAAYCLGRTWDLERATA